MSKIQHALVFAAIATAIAFALPAITPTTAGSHAHKTAPAVTPGHTALTSSSAKLFPAFLKPARPPNPGLVMAAYLKEGDGGNLRQPKLTRSIGEDCHATGKNCGTVAEGGGKGAPIVLGESGGRAGKHLAASPKFGKSPI
jgi:hypothetical protein